MIHSAFRHSLLALTALLAITAGGQNIPATVEELSADKAYTIRNPHFSAYAISSPDNHDHYVWAAEMIGDDDHPIKNPSYSLPLDPASPYRAWMIVNYEGQWYIYNIGARQFLVVGETGGIQATTLQDTPIPVTIAATDDGLFTFITTDGQRNYMCAAPQMDYPVSVWTADDAGSVWQVEEDTLVAADRQACIDLIERRLPATLTIITRNGNIYPRTDGGGFPDQVTPYEPLTFSAQSLSGYTCPDGVRVRHGRNLHGPRWADGRQQWSEFTLEATEDLTTIPADSIDGDIMITALWEQTDPDAMQMVFSDEFDGLGEPDARWWTRTLRQGSTWNRWCSSDPRVVFQQGGALHCLAIPTPSDSQESTPMLTGGIKSLGLVSFQYGHAEARIKTNQWRGNFPAFWMMPASSPKGWPNDGEIDIWETIDASTQSWHTVHTNWTFNLHHGPNSQTFGPLDYSLWHTFAVDWDESSITWYVDGQRVWSYTKSIDPSALDQGQWPFDAPFYLILNQSVGDGSWAANADTVHTYETLFDWVRVYQPADITGLDELGVRSEELGMRNEELGVGNGQSAYDLQGRKLSPFPSGGAGGRLPNGQLPKGIYIIGGKKVVK
ncbi:MAG: glycoside hydrolase family 16 protein [Bacteroidales bacterium]|nr:glycoside hydrolase family 16 protein [Bacteroidales bacterium]